MTDRRKAPRFELTLRCLLSHKTPAGEAALVGRTKNLSRAGALIECKCKAGEAPGKGALVTADINVDGAKRNLRCHGAVTRFEELADGEVQVAIAIGTMEFVNGNGQSRKNTKQQAFPPLLM